MKKKIKFKKTKVKLNSLQKNILFVLIFLAIYCILLIFDKTIYSFLAIPASENTKNIIFSFQQDLIFFPIIFIFGLICIYFKKEKKKITKKKLLAFIFSVCLSLLIAFIFKNLIFKPRPDMLLGFDSFPSGHATLLFTLFPFIKNNSKILKIIYSIFVTLILLSRFLFGYHYLSDLFAGAMLGYSISLLTKYFFIKT